MVLLTTRPEITAKCSFIYKAMTAPLLESGIYAGRLKFIKQLHRVKSFCIVLQSQTITVSLFVK